MPSLRLEAYQRHSKGIPKANKRHTKAEEKYNLDRRFSYSGSVNPMVNPEKYSITASHLPSSGYHNLSVGISTNEKSCTPKEVQLLL